MTLFQASNNSSTTSTAPTQESTSTETPASQETQTTQESSTVTTPTSFNVPDAYRDSSLAKDIKSEADLWAKLDKLNSAQGGTIKLPTSKSTDEERAQFAEQVQRATHKNFLYVPDKNDEDKSVGFWQSLGAPEAVDGYADPAVEVDNPNYLLPTDTNSVLKSAALSSKMTQDQWESFSKEVQQSHQKSVMENMIQLESDHAGLKTKYGEEYDTVLRNVEGLYKDYFGQEIAAMDLGGAFVEGLY